jgi:hypothetical protein
MSIGGERLHNFRIELSRPTAISSLLSQRSSFRILQDAETLQANSGPRFDGEEVSGHDQAPVLR